ncbi:MAG: carboxylesterase family protein [Alphaproteobacteria bacterium]|nr:carboxylesterase family protein [Alphaproteobacteria bacterium]
MKRLFGWAFAVAALSLGTGSQDAQAQQTCAAGSTVTTTAGQVCGPQQGSLFTYMGVPYAKPPIPANGLRWQPPTAASSWQGVLQAINAGPVCAQGSPPRPGSSEDCLYLNVWTPSPAVTNGQALPVMVFIHGGAFVIGSGSEPLYNGASLAETGNAVVVTLNYRLGALGFLAADKAPDGKAGPVPANLGIQDQNFALQWVQANIKAFGGDPAKVTIFGESAGAMSVGLHLYAVPKSAPLFRAAIMESNPMSVQYRTPTQGSKDGSTYLKMLCAQAGWKKCAPTVAQLQTASLDQVMAAQTAYSGQGSSLWRIIRSGFPEALPWTPVVDGTFVTGQPLDGYAKGMPSKPTLFGTNADEGAIFAGIACAGEATTNGIPNPNTAQLAQCIPAGKTSSPLNPTMYGEAIAGLFKPINEPRITGFKNAAGAQPYKASAATGTSFYNGTAQTFASVINDQSFQCGNLQSANAALKQAPNNPIWAYRFAQPPLFNSYPTVPTQACAPGNGQVCHGNELPYVFNTLNQFVQPVPAADAALAQAMGQAWTSFAANLTPPAGWTRYAANGQVQLFQGSGGTMAPGPAQSSNCTALWDKVSPRTP